MLTVFASQALAVFMADIAYDAWPTLKLCLLSELVLGAVQAATLAAGLIAFS